MKLIVLILGLAFLNESMAQSKHPSFLTVQCLIMTEDSSELENFSATLTHSATSLSYTLNKDGFKVKEKGLYNLTVEAPGYIKHTSAFTLTQDTSLQIVLKQNIFEQRSFVLRTNAVRENSGFVFTNISKANLSRENLGQDLTFLLGNTPSAVATSDAGFGIGYTGIRIRGSDATRINVTINGIPINDAESHGVFWVNMPDLASSISQIQVQRGVGSSTIGTGAFGANINLLNTEISDEAFVQMQQAVGSFNSSKSTLMFGTGRLNNFNFSGRLSKILSDGYIDRASSDLQSFQFNLNFKKNRWALQAVSFGGKEKTYQSWYGTPESRVKGDEAGMRDYAERNYLSEAEKERLLSSGRTYNYYTYRNQTDNYWQNHYQLHLTKSFGESLLLKSSAFATTGRGYYEEYKPDAAFASYGVQDYTTTNDTISSTNLIRQRWLDNVFFGNFTSLQYKHKEGEAVFGLAYTEYRGNHFGQVVWAELALPFGKDYSYYKSKSKKQELNSFLKINQRFKKHWQIDGEIQVRQIKYNSLGNDNDLKAIQFDTAYLFVNPKLAVVHEFNKYKRAYASYSIGRREPVRSDFIDNAGTGLPKPEFLQDLELGYIFHKSKTNLQVNAYYMAYTNQLVVTGELNDVGSPLRRNVDKSFRTGIELVFQYELIEKLLLEGNLNLSRNKIKNFNDVYYNYDSGTVITDIYEETDIAFSPSVIGFIGFRDKHIKNTELAINLKYVGKQYLDNTLNNSRALDAYYLLNFSFQRAFKLGRKSELNLRGMINNITGIFYSNNGYTYKYIYSGKLITENFLYPQSPANFMLGIDFKFL